MILLEINNLFRGKNQRLGWKFDMERNLSFFQVESIITETRRRNA